MTITYYPNSQSGKKCKTCGELASVETGGKCLCLRCAGAEMARLRELLAEAFSSMLSSVEGRGSTSPSIPPGRGTTPPRPSTLGRMRG